MLEPDKVWPFEDTTQPDWENVTNKTKSRTMKFEGGPSPATKKKAAPCVQFPLGIYDDMLGAP